MLTGDDTPTIRNAILKRLGTEPAVHVCDIKFQKGNGEIGVGIQAFVGEHYQTRSLFVLPDPFEIGHLHDEIDEIAAQYRQVRRDPFTEALPVSEEKSVPGSGLRGKWSRYGLRYV